MIDYEWKIKLLDLEITHLREMQEVMRQRQDSADHRYTATEELLHELGEKLVRLADAQAETQTMLAETQGMLQDLIRALKAGANGH